MPAVALQLKKEKKHVLIGAATVLMGVALLFGKVLAALIQEWRVNEDYSHGLLVPFVIAYIVYEKRAQLASLAGRPSWWGAVLAALSVVMYLIGFLGAEFFLQRFSILMFVAGVILFVFGWSHLQEAMLALLLFALAIPLPAIIFNEIALPLQLFASALSETVLHVLHVPVFREGNILELPQMKLSVAEACSGIRSLMSLLTLSILIAYFIRGQAWQKALIVISAIPVAILCNAIRISGTGVLALKYGPAAAQGFFHSFSGWLVFIVAALLLFGEVKLFDIATRGESE